VFGGGIFSENGSLKLIDSKVVDNLARATAGFAHAFGGGIYRNHDMTLIRTTVKDNRAVADDGGQDSKSLGGGIYDDEGHVEIRSSHIDGNKARVNGPAGGANAEGGGLYMGDGESLLVVHSTLSGNRASATTGGTAATANGGGIGGTVTHGTISGSRISSNSVHAASTLDGDTGGGGIGLQLLETLELVSTRVASNEVDVGGAGNTGAGGGGIQLRQGTLELQRSTVDRNTTVAPTGGGGSSSGAGILAFGDLVLKSSTVSRNVANSGQTNGGGIELVGTGTGTITNSTIAANKAQGSTARGGGIDTFVNLDLTSSTIAGNSAKIGGGLYKEVGTTILQGTIVAANTASDSGPNCGGSNIDSSGQNLISNDAGCTFTALPSDILDKAAKLGSLGQYGGPTQTIPLQSGSPARNAVPVAKCQVNKDQRGVKRPQGPRCEIGAFEVKQ
jgi:hypothetical protein